MRAFIAIDLPETLAARLGEAQAALAAVTRDVRWVDPSQMHLTLAFFAELPDARLADLLAAMAAASAAVPPFSLAVQGVGHFGRRQIPTVLWAGVDGGPHLSRLHAALTTGLLTAAFPVDERPFAPHLTLGRVTVRRPQPALAGVLEEQAGVCFGSVAVEELRLYRSVLGRGGPEHTPIHAVRLSGAA